jgi:hypothetical protein
VRVVFDENLVVFLLVKEESEEGEDGLHYRVSSPYEQHPENAHGSTHPTNHPDPFNKNIVINPVCNIPQSA